MARASLIDIACNLTDPMFRGVYGGKQRHEDDLDDVLSRSKDANVGKIIITGTDLCESMSAVSLASGHGNLFATVGCHPTRCKEFGETEEQAEEYLSKLRQVITSSSKVVAVGELGLDYDRTHFCPIPVQKKGFERQLALSQESKLPLFLHCRNAFAEFHDILSRNRDKFVTGVVHSFDGTAEQAQAFIDMGLFIGLNGCSLKTEDNLSAVKSIPADKILLETDAPWCEVKPSHAGFKYLSSKIDSRKKEKFVKGMQVKGRNEPCNIVNVLDIVAVVKGIDRDELAEQVRVTTESVFKLSASSSSLSGDRE
jgi:TatD DNase family protein